MLGPISRFRHQNQFIRMKTPLFLALLSIAAIGASARESQAWFFDWWYSQGCRRPATSESWMDEDFARLRRLQCRESCSAGYPYSSYTTQTYAIDATGSSLQANVNTTSIVVLVPESAKLWFDDRLTAGSGTERYFTTPELQPHRTYKYQLRVSWIDNSGRAVTRTRDVSVEAGKKTVVVFDFVAEAAR
jgi:uncharacterized protein (TIGR03000 family)